MILLKSLLYEQITPTRQLNVLFIGDSQTASPTSYAKQLIANGIVTGDVVAKSGISMKSIAELFKINYKIGKYDIISILGGNNDASNSKFDQSSFKTIINIANRNNTPVIVVTAPTMKFINTRYYPGKYPAQDSIPIWQKSLESDNVKIIDAYSLLNSKSNFIKDGLHLNKDAQKLIMKVWVQIAKNIEPTAVDDTKIVTDIKNEGSLRYGDVGNDVKSMQENLIKLNYSVGSESNDGIFGPHTRAGVEAFQLVNRIEVDGIFTENMLKLIEDGNAINCPDNIRIKLDNSIVASNHKLNTPLANVNDSAKEQAFALIAKFESFIPTGKQDTDGIYRIGYGSSTITKEDGTIIKMGYRKTAHVISQEDAARDLTRRIEDEFLPAVLSTIRKWGQDPTKFNDATLAVLTSICYNYGSLKSSLRPAIESGDATAVATAIAALSANKKRRIKESNYILGSLNEPEVKKGTTGIEKSTNNTQSKPSVLKPSTITKQKGTPSGSPGSGVLKHTPDTGDGGILDNLLNTVKLAVLAAPFKEAGSRNGFGMRLHPIKKIMRMHWGVDFGKSAGTPVVVNMPGKCILSQYSDSAGNYVKILHDDGAVTTYMHFSKLIAKVGDTLTTGDIIGLVGDTGLSKGAHLHFEYRPSASAEREDPLPQAPKYFSFGTKEELLANQNKKENDV